jgi:hypothetical protein
MQFDEFTANPLAQLKHVKPSEVQVEQFVILSVHKNIPDELVKYVEFRIQAKEAFNS